MKTIRTISRILKGKPILEGAGVRLNRVFGYYEVPLLDPFLLLDDFHSDNPDDYVKGFPWHPHRGIETMTYMLQGSISHEDSIGNKGVIHGGDAQWMTAGSGIIHSEMPGQDRGLLWGLQLWVNLPASLKMSEPQYREITSGSVPIVESGGSTVRIIAGDYEGTRGPAREIAAEPHYLDVTIGAGQSFKVDQQRNRTVFAYIIEGTAAFEQGGYSVGPGNLVLFSNGDTVQVSSGPSATRLILVSGNPFGEPVAWQGPIVMNTDRELAVAFEEYHNGTFLKHRMAQ